MKKYIIVFLFQLVACITFSQAPVNYYSQAEGKQSVELKTALHNIIREHVYLSFTSNNSQLWWNEYYYKADWHPDGYYWDMYSNDTYADYNGIRQNREHCMPRSWWGTASDYGQANDDLYNLYPSNAAANIAKSNYPLGLTQDERFNNQVTKVGTSTFSGYTSIVFEPADEYKGDFARTYMYMVTCYEDYSQKWRELSASMLNNNTFPVFNEYAVTLLVKWHRDDPVSEKEINRNNAVYGIQHNRNPFIDYPELAEYIWGNNKNEVWGITTGINETEKMKISVIPNPAKTHIKISADFLDKASYSIYGISGILTQRDELLPQKEISIETLQNGMYFCEITADDMRSITKFLVNR